MSTDTPHVPPGRLGDQALTLGTDPRSDPRMVAVFGALGALDHPPANPLTRDAGRETMLGFSVAAEEAFEGLFTVLAQDLKPVDGVSHEVRTVTRDGHEIALHVHRPDGVDGPLPVIVQIHGGGMVMLSATGALYSHWRDELAKAGAVVVGVDYRNAGGVAGANPFPTGLDDCAAAVRWVYANRAELGGTHIVVTGDSGGANLSLAVAIKANREGWVGEIAGVYAQCPYILGRWEEPPAELHSLWENDKYWLDRALFPLLAEVYDPDDRNVDDPTCWPLRAQPDDLRGLPPHVISVNEVDPLRDEGVAYHRMLLDAGVPSIGKVNLGLCHVGELLFQNAMPEVYAEAVRDVTGFARSLASS
ncbi:alpha/beta fold hydrolase [Actinomycetospora sp. CA-084318]|uniref:alpha/beta fold hydrolase n=1 Tax=Actinomycetospora sp. CA-084318 TaxID=3239892 RepID=UPI003D96D12B